MHGWVGMIAKESKDMKPQDTKGGDEVSNPQRVAETLTESRNEKCSLYITQPPSIAGEIRYIYNKNSVGMSSYIEKELKHYLGILPQGALKDLLAYAKKLRQDYEGKQPVNSLQKELNMLSAQESSHLEEEFKDYRKLYPRE